MRHVDVNAELSDSKYVVLKALRQRPKLGKNILLRSHLCSSFPCTSPYHDAVTVNACSGSNNYGFGHSCTYGTAQGTAQGSTCQTNSDGVLVCP
ncbi:hypothetical protein F5146DRAFT_1012186 [Armillaria mellea]|nr:hypothetical protein F5146DRAFT_1012186 [Armillaria mellea]